MSHPLIVEAAESLFTPVCIYNNVSGGHDAQVLKSFKEPTWNYPVIRIVDQNGKDLVPRHSKDFSRAGLWSTMQAALKKNGRTIPKWFQFTAAEATTLKRGVDTAIFGMS